MEFTPPLQRGTLLGRYKRFFADIRLDSGDTITAHCPNTGAMTGCAVPGAVVWVQHHDNPRRKLAWTWELVDTGHGLACIHAARANALVLEALGAGRLAALAGYDDCRREPRHGNGRADFLLTRDDQRCLVEVKSVTLWREGGVGAFPDAVSERATRHLGALAESVAQGDRAVLLFAALHTGITRVRPAADIDPRYARALRDAATAGVELLALGMTGSAEGISLTRPLAVMCE